MSISVDTINLRFNVKPDYDQQQLQQLQEDLKNGQKELEKTRRAMDKLAKNGLNAMTKEEREEFDRLSASLSKTAREVHENEQKMKRWTDNVNINKLSLQQLGQRAKDLRAVLNNLNPQTDDFKEYKAELDRVNERMKELRSTADITKTSLSKFVDGFNKVSWAIQFAYQGFQKVVQWADQYVQSFAKMDEAMTDVMKYTGQTKREVEEMNETFKQMTTRTSREELNALAGAAGRLGITGRKDIEGFVDAADKINVALGDDLGEGAIDQIGKLAMVFGEDKTKGLNGAMLATGSAINVLGASSSASTGFITEFTAAMAGMAVNAKISQTDIMGYASALSQAGIEGQTASGVFAQMITKMFTDPAKFAKAAGLEVKAFTDLLKTDANQAILQFLDGLKQRGGFDSLAPALKSLGMQGTQAVPVISSLINKMGELKQAQQTAATAYDEGTSIIDEFNNANSSAAAKLEIAKKGLNDVSAELGQKLMPIVEGGLTTSKVVLQILSEVAGFVTRNIATLSRLAIGVGAYTAAVQIATNATKIWATVTKATPWGLVLGGIAAVLVAYDKYKTRLAETRKLQEELNKVDADATTKYAEQSREVKRLDAALRDERVSIDERRKALDRLKAIIPEYNGMLDEEGRLTRDNKKAIDDYLVSLQKQIRLKAYKDKLEELYTRQATQEEEQRTASDNYWNARQTNTLQGGNSPVMSLMRWLGIGEEASLKRALDAADKSLADTNGKITTLENRIKDLGGSVISTTESTPESAGNGSGSGKSDSEMKKEQTERDRLRKEKEEQAKADWEQTRLRLRQEQQERFMTEEEFHDRSVAAELQYLSQMADIRKQYGASQAGQTEVQNQLLDFYAREANYERAQQQKQMNAELQAAELSYAADQVALERMAWDGRIKTDADYEARKLEAERDYQQQRIAIIRRYGGDAAQEQQRLDNLELQQARTAAERRQKELEAAFAGRNADGSKAKPMSTQDKLQALDQNAEILGWQRTQEMKTQILQEEEQKRQQILQEEEQKRQQIQQEAFSAVGQLMQSTSSLFSALQQRETAEVDAKYKKLIAAAKKQGRDTTKLEEQQEAEKAAIQKKYAQKQFRMQILQIIAATAQSIANVWKEWAANPPVAAAFSAVAAAQGAIQLATAKAQADQAAGLYEGGFSGDYQEGFTRKGNPREQDGVIPVHRNEFVANHRAVANPHVLPVLKVIDRHQRQGDIQLLNTTRLLDEAYGQGLRRGGFSTGSPNDGAGTDSSYRAADTQSAGLSVIIPWLKRIERNTATALTVRTLRDEIRHEERLEQRAAR